MRPLKNNPGEVLNMWAAKHHRALVTVIIEVAFALIGEDPNVYVEHEEEDASEIKSNKGQIKVDQVVPKKSRQDNKKVVKSKRYSIEQMDLLKNVEFVTEDEEDFLPTAAKKLMIDADLLKKKALSAPPSKDDQIVNKLPKSKICPPASTSPSEESPAPDSTPVLMTKSTPVLMTKPTPLLKTKPNVVNQFSTNLKPFLEDYCQSDKNSLQEFNAFLQITKIVQPLTENEMVTLYLSDGERGIVGKLKVDFFVKVLGGQLQQFSIVKIARATGHAITGDLVIVSLLRFSLKHFLVNFFLIRYGTNFSLIIVPLQDHLFCPKSVQLKDPRMLGSPIFPMPSQNVTSSRRRGGFNIMYVVNCVICYLLMRINLDDIIAISNGLFQGSHLTIM